MGAQVVSGQVTRWVWDGHKPLHELARLKVGADHAGEVVTWLFEEASFALVGKKDGRLAGDAGGHLIGFQFGGHGNNSNMVAMMHDGVNAYPNGTWGSMEKSWADALADGKKVEVDITPVYKDAIARPHSFEIVEIIDGIPGIRTINNF